MPADPAAPTAPSAHHGDASRPYVCSTWQQAPGAAWSIEYGYCRHSLDLHTPGDGQGAHDPRCPPDCRHKAPEQVARRFAMTYIRHGNAAAAAEARRHRQDHPPA